jgi:hypothetical protein
MVSQNIKSLTLECELLWNMIISKNEPPYYAFTLEKLVSWMMFLNVFRRFFPN